jgi:hypothetical protein
MLLLVFLMDLRRCLKYNGLVVQRLLREKFTNGKLMEIRDGFKYR